MKKEPLGKQLALVIAAIDFFVIIGVWASDVSWFKTAVGVYIISTIVIFYYDYAKDKH